jgi:succinylarginine dihydrolase
VARLHGLNQDHAIFAQQAEVAIAAGAFHNDVVAVANERVLFTHEQAFEQPEALYGAIRKQMPDAEIVIVPADKVSLADAIKSYLFNAQLVTLPDDGGMALILPSEARENISVWRYLTDLVAGNGPIRRLCPVDVRQSMANGGGPACLRLRVVADPTNVDQRFLATTEKLEAISRVVTEYWPEAINPDQLSDPGLAKAIVKARNSLLDACGLIELQG